MKKPLRCRNCVRKLANGLREESEVGAVACGICKRCANCGCYCVQCSTCHRTVPQYHTQYCDHCRTCKKHCECRRMPYFVRTKLAPNERFHINPMPRTLGLELELSDWGKLRDEASFKNFTYSRAHDWSVRPSEYEMVIAPLRGDQFLRAMFELAERLYRAKAKVNTSCAFHVHVGGSDLSYWNLRNILRIYECLEDEIYDHLILPHRRNDPVVTHYCQMLTRTHAVCPRCQRFDRQYPGQRRPLVPLRDTLERMNGVSSTTELKSEFIRMLYGLNTHGVPEIRRKDVASQLQTRKGGRYEWCRYVGLNLHAWMYRGTLEFRMKEGTTNFEDLIAWPLWCGWFVEAAASMPERRTRNSSMGLLQFTAEFMPSWITEWVDRKIRDKNKPVMEQAPDVPGDGGNDRNTANRYAERVVRDWTNVAEPPTPVPPPLRHMAIDALAPLPRTQGRGDTVAGPTITFNRWRNRTVPAPEPEDDPNF